MSEGESGDLDGGDKQRAVYLAQAEIYDRLVSAEDTARNLDAALAAAFDWRGARVLDMGCGTGRMSRVLFGLGVRHVLGVDRAGPMLDVARERLAPLLAEGQSFELCEADAREVDVGREPFDAAVAGWVFGHFRHWMPDGWRADVGRALDRLEQAVRPGGVAIVVETLGTNHESPRAHAALDEYFTFLEEERGYTRTWVRTDYLFASAEEACEVLGAFFPEELIAAVRARGSAAVPECTGIWSRRRD
ncbi:MAG: class I SAM-dependent methyltransferase [Polyangiaceae bacterium]